MQLAQYPHKPKIGVYLSGYSQVTRILGGKVEKAFP